MDKIKRRLFLANLLLVAGVVLSIVGCNYLVDPFNRWGPGNGHLKKREVAYYADHRLWTMARLSSEPCENLLLGDSRMARLGEPLVEAAAGERYVNGAYGGATLSEMISIYRWAAEREDVKLKHVIFGINFMQLNARLQSNFVTHTVEVLDNPFRYLLDPRVTLASLGVLNYNYLGGAGGSDKPPMGREAFWRYEVEVAAKNHFQDFVYYEAGVKELRAVADDCRQKHIELAVLIFPEHLDYLRRIEDFHQSAKYERFRRDMREIFPVVIDLSDLPGNAERENFADPLHFEVDYARRWLPEVFAKAQGDQASEPAP